MLIGTEKSLFRWAVGELESYGQEEYVIRGVVRLQENGLLAVGTGVETESGVQPILLSYDEGESWVPYSNNYVGDSGINFINALTSIQLGSDTLFAKGTGGVTARSLNGGESWELVTSIWNNCCGLGMFVKIDPFVHGRT